MQTCPLLRNLFTCSWRHWQSRKLFQLSFSRNPTIKLLLLRFQLYTVCSKFNQPLSMKQLSNIYYSFPVQLFILHFRKYQILLLFWFVLASTVNSGFMKSYGADALFFAPE